MSYRTRFASTLPLVMACVLIVLAPPASAQLGPEVRVTDCQARGDQPDVAVDSLGNAHLVYFDECGTTEREIFYSMLDPDGNILIDSTLLTTDEGDSDKHPAVVVDSNDMVLMVFSDRTTAEILFTKLDPGLDDQDGSPADPAVIKVVDGAELTVDVDSYLTHPRLALDGNDDIHVVFEEDGDEVYYLKADNDGAVLIPTIHIRTCSSWYGRPDVDVDSNDDVHIAWNDYEDTSEDEIYYMMLDGATGATLIDATLITVDDGDRSVRQTIQVDDADKVHIVWHDKGTQEAEIFYTKLDPSLDDRDGSAADPAAITLIDDIVLTPDDNVTSKNPQTCRHGAHICISYYEDTGVGFDIYTMIIDTDGNVDGPPTALTTSGSVSYTTSAGDNAPNIDVSADGRARVVWCDDRHGECEVYYTHYDSGQVPVFLADFRLEPDGAAVHAAWQVHGDRPATDFRLEGGDGRTQWEVPCRQVAPGRFAAEDRAAALAAGGAFDYLLYFREGGQDWQILAYETVTVTVPPLRTRIGGIFPNPFNPKTTVAFAVDRPQRIRVAIYDLTGRRVALLADRNYPVGVHEIAWDGVDEGGRVAATGVYVCRLEGEDVADAKRVVMMK